METLASGSGMVEMNVPTPAHIQPLGSFNADCGLFPQIDRW
jgi:hypothetical protein